MLSVHGLAKSYGDREVLQGVTFSLEPREKVGLVGANGTGKTTLLRLIAGLDAADHGRITVASWARPAYLSQSPDGAGEDPVIAHVMSGAAQVRALDARAHELEHLMATPEVHDDPRRLAAVLDEYGRVREHFEHAGGFEVETRARMVLGGLGFGEGDAARPLREMSGGWRARAELARVLLSEPDLLLLDEPTNHLDMAATEWLEEHLAAFPGAAIVVSHDRYLLDAVTSRTLELEGGRVESHPGAYSAYARLRAERKAGQREAWERQQQEIARLQDYIRRYRAGNRATQAKSREKMLARVASARVEAPRAQTTMRVRPEAAPPSGRTVVRLRQVSKRFADRVVLRGVDLEVRRGERVGLVGPNGAGKTTLLRLIAGAESPTSGHVTLGVGVRPGYFAQESLASLDPERNVLDEILSDRPLTPEQVRSYLGRFLFSGEDVFKPVAMLSGGERQRLSLAALLLERPNLLLLDEPTNHLDVPSREALEEALREFTGTMIVATHDRYLLERLATRIVTMDESGITDFAGTYHELREERARVGASGGLAGGGRPRADRADGQGPRRALRSAGDQGSGTRKNAGASRGTAPRRAARVPAPTFEQVAREIEAVEREIEDAARWLADPDLYRDPERARAMRARYEEAERRLAKLYDALAEAERGDQAGRDG